MNGVTIDELATIMLGEFQFLSFGMVLLSLTIGLLAYLAWRKIKYLETLLDCILDDIEDMNKGW